MRVARAETDEVLRSEIAHLSKHGRLLLPGYRHQLQCDQLALTSETKHTLHKRNFRNDTFFIMARSSKQYHCWAVPSMETSFTWQLSQTTVKSWQIFSAVVGKKTTCKDTLATFFCMLNFHIYAQLITSKSFCFQEQNSVQLCLIRFSRNKARVHFPKMYYMRPIIWWIQILI